VHFPCVQDRPQAHDARFVGRGDGAVARGEQAGQGGQQTAEQKWLGEVVCRAQQDEHPVPPVGDRVAVLVTDTDEAEGPRDEPIELATEFPLDGIGSLSRGLDVNRQDAAVHGKRNRPARPPAIERGCGTVCLKQEGGGASVERPDRRGRYHDRRAQGRSNEARQVVPEEGSRRTVPERSAAARRWTSW